MEKEEIEQGQLVSKDLLESITEQFPAGIIHSFGYGSGVFAQQDIRHHYVNSTKSADVPMLDLIFVVANSKEWHANNLIMNEEHYSSIPKAVGPEFIDRIQKYGSGKVYFNPLVTLSVNSTSEPRSKVKQDIKYGVVEKSDLLDDLLQWKYLYIAGRLHKPTVLIRKDDEIIEAQHQNIDSALSAALLLKSSRANFEEKLSFSELFETIANISYAGDPRMKVRGEDPNKVSKLVNSPGQMQRWHELYTNTIESLERRGIVHVDSNSQRPSISWKTDTSTCNTLIEYLPPLVVRKNREFLLKGSDLAEVLSKIVAPAARHQSMKGLVTAGLFKSVRYAGAKFAKGFARS